MSTDDHNFVVCTNNDGYPAALEVRKLYERLDDPDAQSHGMIRIVDESGESYIYPEKNFLPIELPDPIYSCLWAAG